MEYTIYVVNYGWYAVGKRWYLTEDQNRALKMSKRITLWAIEHLHTMNYTNIFIFECV